MIPGGMGGSEESIAAPFAGLKAIVRAQRDWSQLARSERCNILCVLSFLTKTGIFVLTSLFSHDKLTRPH